jgi:hypothetical protein
LRWPGGIGPTGLTGPCPVGGAAWAAGCALGCPIATPAIPIKPAAMSPTDVGRSAHKKNLRTQHLSNVVATPLAVGKIARPFLVVKDSSEGTSGLQLLISP